MTSSWRHAFLQIMYIYLLPCEPNTKRILNLPHSVSEICQKCFKITKNLKFNIKSLDDVMMTSSQFSSISHTCLNTYQVSTESHLPFYRYRALKYSTLWWRHVTHDDVTMTSLACTHYIIVLFACAKFEGNHMNRSVKFDEQNKNCNF